MMVVDVLMMSCQVSLKPKNGPLTAQMMTQPMATTKAAGCPTARAVPLAKWVNQADMLPDPYGDPDSAGALAEDDLDSAEELASDEDGDDRDADGMAPSSPATRLRPAGAGPDRRRA